MRQSTGPGTRSRDRDRDRGVTGTLRGGETQRGTAEGGGWPGRHRGGERATMPRWGLGVRTQRSEGLKAGERHCLYASSGKATSSRSKEHGPGARPSGFECRRYPLLGGWPLARKGTTELSFPSVQTGVTLALPRRALAKTGDWGVLWRVQTLTTVPAQRKAPRGCRWGQTARTCQQREPGGMGARRGKGQG